MRACARRLSEKIRTARTAFGIPRAASACPADRGLSVLVEPSLNLIQVSLANGVSRLGVSHLNHPSSHSSILRESFSNSETNCSSDRFRDSPSWASRASILASSAVTRALRRSTLVSAMFPYLVRLPAVLWVTCGGIFLNLQLSLSTQWYQLKWLRNGGQLRLRQMRRRSNCVRWCRIHHRQGGQ